MAVWRRWTLRSDPVPDPARYAGEWLQFRRHQIGIPRGNPNERVKSPAPVCPSKTGAFRSVWIAVPLMEEFAGTTADALRASNLKVCWRSSNGARSKPLALRMEMMLSTALAMAGRSTRPTSGWTRSSEVSGHARRDAPAARRVHNQRADWQNSYESLVKYPRRGQAAALTADLV